MFYKLVDDYDNEIIGFVESKKDLDTIQKLIYKARKELDTLEYYEVIEYVKSHSDCKIHVFYPDDQDTILI